jgi:hypothetical protein
MDIITMCLLHEWLAFCITKTCRYMKTNIKWLSNCDCAIVKLIYEYAYPLPVDISVHDSIPGLLTAYVPLDVKRTQSPRTWAMTSREKTACGTLTNARKQMSNLPKQCPRGNAGRKSHQGLADCLTEATSPDFVPR